MLINISNMVKKYYFIIDNNEILNNNTILKFINKVFSYISLIIACIGVLLCYQGFNILEFKSECFIDNFFSDSFILFLKFYDFILKIFLQTNSLKEFLNLIIFINISSVLFSLFSILLNNKKECKGMLSLVCILFFTYVFGLCYGIIFYGNYINIDKLIVQSMENEIKTFEYDMGKMYDNYDLPNKIREKFFMWDNYVEGENKTEVKQELTSGVGINVQPTNMSFNAPNGICFYYKNGEIIYANEGIMTIKNLGPSGPYLLRGVYFDIPSLFRLVPYDSNLEYGEISIRLNIENKYYDLYELNKSLDIEILHNDSIDIKYEINLNPSVKNENFFMRFPIYFDISFNTI